MTNVEFKNIYNLVEKLQLKNYEKEYQRLLALDNEIGSFMSLNQKRVKII